MTSLTRWERLPEVLPGEDRSFGSGLFIDMIPSTSWFRNVRAALFTDDRRGCAHGLRPGRSPVRSVRLAAAQSIGEVPGGARTIRLRRRDPGPGTTAADLPVHVVPLLTHFGLPRSRPKLGRAKAWLETVQNIYMWHSDAHIREAFAAWEARNQIAWTLDLTVITTRESPCTNPSPRLPRHGRPGSRTRRTAAAGSLPQSQRCGTLYLIAESQRKDSPLVPLSATLACEFHRFGASAAMEPAGDRRDDLALDGKRDRAGGAHRCRALGFGIAGAGRG